MKIRETAKHPITQIMPEDQIDIISKIQSIGERPIAPGIEIDPEDQIPASDFHNTTSLTDVSMQQPGKFKDKMEGWIYQEFPSRNIPYDDKTDIHVRPIEIPILAQVHAAQERKSFTGLLDAIQYCIDRDIRDLTVPDFYFFMYWLRINSYPRSPLTLEWTSKYGNVNNTEVSMSSFEIVDLKMAQETFDGWRERGLKFPTIRDTEALTEDLPKDQKWMVEYAQYIHVDGPIGPDHMQKKVDAFVSMGVEAVTDIRLFAEEIDHGIVERLEVVDKNFEIHKAIESMKMEVENLTKIVKGGLESGDEQTINGIASIAEHIDSRQEEIDRMQSYIDDEDKDENDFKPEKEVVELGVADATLLFP